MTAEAASDVTRAAANGESKNKTGPGSPVERAPRAAAPAPAEASAASESKREA